MIGIKRGLEFKGEKSPEKKMKKNEKAQKTNNCC